MLITVVPKLGNCSSPHIFHSTLPHRNSKLTAPVTILEPHNYKFLKLTVGKYSLFDMNKEKQSQTELKDFIKDIHKNLRTIW